MTVEQPPVAFITGAGRGIGRAIAIALARGGMDIALAARTLSELREVEAMVTGLGRRGAVLELDVTSDDQVARAFERCRASLGAPTVLVNNAGIAPSHKFMDIDPDTWRAVLEVNLTGAYLCTRAALPAMLAAGTGRIINIASTAGKTGYRFTAAYTASKHGLLGLTRALAVEVAGKGVTVNAVCPGFTKTRITDEAAAVIAAKTDRSIVDSEAELAAMSPMKRLIEPDEVARIVAFLAHPDSAGITGQAWGVDAGALPV